MYQRTLIPIRGLLFIFVALAALHAYGTHIVGGELNYKFISENTYEIDLALYRDCDFGNAEYDSLAWIRFFDANNNFVEDLKIKLRGRDTIPLSINSNCATVPSGLCYEYTHYIDTVLLPTIPGGYQMAYQRCCWNLTVNNIKNPSNSTTPGGSRGLTIYGKIPDPNIVRINSNPIFQDLTPPFICLGTEFEFDHRAIDPDGDSLAYRIVTPYDFIIPTVQNSPPHSPPYGLATYQAGYSLSNVMGGEPLRIDPVTGYVNARPVKEGQFVYAIQVMEYRDGVQISSTTRSYQLNVRRCPDLTYAFIDAPDAVCGSNDVFFGNDSQGAKAYMWDFGDPSNPGSTSTDYEPNYTYPGNGQYKVSLIAVSQLDSAECNDTTIKMLTISDEYSATAHLERDPCLNVGDFFGDATKVGTIGSDYFWKFGDGDVGYTKNASHKYNKNQQYIVTLIAQLNQNHVGCIDSVKMEYNGFDSRPGVDATANKYFIYQKADSAFLYTESPQKINKYSWKPITGLSDPTVPNPIAKPKETTSYIVTITDVNGCKNKDTVTIHINPYRCGESEIFVPNAFTPNHDGENDYFRVRGEDIKELYLAVYNRWGQLIYESEDSWMINDEKFGWDGTFNGESLSTGVFVYYLRAVCPGDYEFIKKGNVTLIR